jgi:fasciclin domain-containing protein
MRMPDASKRISWSRFFKYLFLLVVLAVTLKIVFDGFSYYIARRSLDAELAAKKISSLEYLVVLTKRQRALVLASLETRCLERDQLAVFRIGDAELSQQLWKAYDLSYKVKSNLIYQLDHLPDEKKAKINLQRAKDEVNKAEFTLLRLERVVAPAPNVERNEDYAAVAKEVIELLKKAADADAEQLAKYADVRAQVVEKLKRDQIDLKTIDILERRLSRLKDVREETRKKLGDIEEVLSRYAVWTEALTGGFAESPVLDEMAFEIEQDDKSRLRSLDCGNLERYYSKVNGRPFRTHELLAEDWDNLNVRQKLMYYPSAIATGYRGAIFNFFSIPPVAQTLFVTLFLGALGAATINVLRLSKVGWWASANDPLWGEIIISPFIGALAAFGIFLVASAGLLLSSDSGQSGATSLSAFFIGLLGFVSGLLYDEAFGRVRRVGSQLFGSDTPSAAAASAEDRSLAEVLRKANASLAADLALKFGIGSRICAEPEFTLLIPSDDAMNKLTLKAWRDISEAVSRPKFENWFRHHHALKRVTSTSAGGGAAVSEIQVEDGTKYPIAVDAGGFTIGTVKVLQADIDWGPGVIHILEAELPYG